MPGIAEVVAAIAGLSSSGGSPSPKPAPAATPTEQTQTATDTRTKQEASLESSFPNIQAATGGSLSPEAWATLAKLLTGNTNAPGIDSATEDLLKKFFGDNVPLIAGITPSGGSVTPTGLTATGGGVGG